MLGYNITSIRYGDDTVLVSENEHDLRKLVDAIAVHSKQLVKKKKKK